MIGKWSKLLACGFNFARSRSPRRKAFQLTLRTESRYSGKCLVTHCTVLVEQSFDRGPLLFFCWFQSSARPPDNRAVAQPGLHQCSSCRSSGQLVIHRLSRLLAICFRARGGMLRGVRGTSTRPQCVRNPPRPQASRDLFHSLPPHAGVTQITVFVHRRYPREGCMTHTRPLPSAVVTAGGHRHGHQLGTEKRHYAHAVGRDVSQDPFEALGAPIGSHHVLPT